MNHRNQKFEAHHHHHQHHSHVEYRAPFNITTEIGLFSLKKLNAMNPDILKEKEKRLLNPSAPGVITYVAHSFLLFTTPIYAFTMWKNFGFKSFVSPKVFIPLGLLMGTSIGFQHVANYARELTFAYPRSKLVQKYKDQYGEKFLIDVLEPTFRLPKDFERL